MNNNPLVSICIPTCNGKRYIDQCISSAMNQSYNNIEIIISDDQSTDDTLNIANVLLEKTTLNYKIIINNSTGFVADNWNNAIKQASGKYIKMLFQDDYLYSNCIEKMVELVNNHKDLGLIFSLRDPIYEKHIMKNPETKLTIDFISNQKTYLGDVSIIQEGINLIKNKYLLSGSNIIGEPSNVLINKNVFNEIGYFNPKILQLIDLEMWYRILLNYKIGFINKSLSGFRIHYNQLSYKNKDHVNQVSKEQLTIYNKLYENLIILNFNKYYLSILKEKIKKMKASKKKYWPILKPLWKLFFSLKRRAFYFIYTK